MTLERHSLRPFCFFSKVVVTFYHPTPVHKFQYFDSSITIQIN